MRPVILFLAAAIALTACSKNNPGAVKAVDPIAPPDTIYRLKEITERGMPSPYFHFDLNENGSVKEINFAQGFFIYRPVYEGSRIVSMTNIQDKSLLQYNYSGNEISSIRKTDSIGQPMWLYRFRFSNGRPSEIDWIRFRTTQDSIIERRVLLEYFADGNLRQYQDLWRDATDVLSLSRTVRFSAYDHKKNVDDFYLLKNFFEDLLYVPGLRLQENNPGLVELSGASNDFRIEYLYDYRGSVPAQRRGLFRQTRGDGPSAATELLTNYFYY
jgi:hypothetical protein